MERVKIKEPVENGWWRMMEEKEGRKKLCDCFSATQHELKKNIPWIIKLKSLIFHKYAIRFFFFAYFCSHFNIISVMYLYIIFVCIMCSWMAFQSHSHLSFFTLSHSEIWSEKEWERSIEWKRKLMFENSFHTLCYAFYYFSYFCCIDV